MSARLSRADVPVEQTWDLSALFADAAAWEAEYQAVDAACETLAQHQGRLGDSAGALLAALNAWEDVWRRQSLLHTHAYLANAQDGGDARHQAVLARSAALAARVDAASSFVDAEILALPPERLEAFIAAEPALAEFRSHFDELQAQRPHRLGAEAERTLAALGEVLNAPYMVYARGKAGDLRFADFTDAAGQPQANSFNRFESGWESHPDAALRRAAWASFSTGLKGMRHTWAATFATEVRKNVALARLRGHASTEDYLLHPHRIPRPVYDQVLDVVQAEMAPHMQRYARLRRRVLGLDALLYCDLKTPLEPEFNPRVPYAEACTMILDALAVMGPQYQAFARRALTERWVDRADNTGKGSGAFCASPYGVHPYILITWSDTLRNAFTLAHELGHAGHFGLAMAHQRFVNTRPSLPFIEAPSTLNEMLLAQHLLAHSREPRWRRSVILQVLGTFHHNFVTHLLEAELQRRVYALAEAGTSPTADWLDAQKGEVLARFWGDTVQLDDGARMTWMRQPHYYLGLYPYTYAVGLAASTALSQRIASEGEPAVERWLAVLRAGGTRGPLELLADAGIDMVSAQVLRDAVSTVGQLVDELEHSLNEAPAAAG